MGRSSAWRHGSPARARRSTSSASATAYGLLSSSRRSSRASRPPQFDPPRWTRTANGSSSPDATTGSTRDTCGSSRNARSLATCTWSSGNDANVRLLKGEGHPLFPQDERRYVVGSCRYVKQCTGLVGHGLDGRGAGDRADPAAHVRGERRWRQAREACLLRRTQHRVRRAEANAEGRPAATIEHGLTRFLRLLQEAGVPAWCPTPSPRLPPSPSIS